MKKIIFIGIIMIAAISAKAQVLGGFFSQQATKEKTMAQQVAYFEIYLQDLKKGYSTTQNGLNTMHELKNGTFTLHQNYFSSLGTVAASVKNDPKIKGITGLQQQIITTFNNALSWQKDKNILSGDELDYMKLVYNNLLAACNKDIDELSIVVTDGKAQMQDGERIHKIDLLYADMQDKDKFSKSFTQKAYVLADQKAAGTTSTTTLKNLYDLK